MLGTGCYVDQNSTLHQPMEPGQQRYLLAVRVAASPHVCPGRPHVVKITSPEPSLFPPFRLIRSRLRAHKYLD